MKSFVIVSFKIQPDHQVNQIYDRRGSLSLNRTIMCPISRRVGSICWSNCLIIKTIGCHSHISHGAAGQAVVKVTWSTKVTAVYASGN